ncbi:hypothetical protein N431DRAFT_346057 [Stipitochalara longipes BDJ]|nr:hypothetical protein N431DRAFT_346057 [Stipitochalara longipes BDJ]
MGVSWCDDEPVDEQESIPDYLDAYDDDDFEEDVKTPVGKGIDLATQKHTAKRKYGERCLPDPSVSRDNAIVGQPDPSKMSIVLQTERPDLATPGSFLPSDPVHFTYTNKVNWDDKESVSKLNSWRYQVFKRTLGQKRESRPPWTINEKDKLIEMMSSHLSLPATGGRYSQINWGEVERNFNQFFQGHIHGKGEMTAETSYNQRGKDYTAKSRKLVADRLHLPRSAGAIENQ